MKDIPAGVQELYTAIIEKHHHDGGASNLSQISYEIGHEYKRAYDRLLWLETRGLVTVERTGPPYPLRITVNV